MRGVKTILLGITILLMIIIAHLFMLSSLIVDPFALVGLAVVFIGFFTKDEPKENPDEKHDGELENGEKAPEPDKKDGEELPKIEP